MKKSFLNYVYAADFETNNSNGQVYSWSASYRIPTYDKMRRHDNQQSAFKEGVYSLMSGQNKEFKSVIGVSIDSFIKWAEGLPEGSVVYFHNGGNFDFWAIYAYLIKEGYFHIQDFDESLKVDEVNVITRLEEIINFNKKVEVQAYKNLLSDQYDEKDLKVLKRVWKQVFKNEYCFINKNNSLYTLNLSNVEFRDSAKMFAMSLASIGDTLNSKHKTDFFKKIDNHDYNTERYYNSVYDLVNNTTDLKYQVKDTDILLQGIIDMTKPFVEEIGAPKITASATAYAIWEKMRIASWIKENNIEKREHKTPSKVFYEYVWDGETFSFNEIKQLALEIFKWDKENDLIFRKYYNGGYVNVNEKSRGIITNHIIDIDITSSYPTIMSSDKLLPVGTAYKNKPSGDYVSVVTYVCVENTKVKNNYPPTLPSRQGFGSIEYLRSVVVGQTFNTTELEYKNAVECYGDCFKILEQWYFKAMPAYKIFGDYINKFFNLKKEAAKNKDKALKEAMKVLLNGLYGKFGSKMLVKSKFYDYNLDGFHNFSEELSPKYLPIAIFITAYARDVLLKPLFNNYNAFLYSDTDSLKFDLVKLGFSEKQIKNKDFVINELEKKLNIKIDKEETGDLGFWTCDHYDINFLGMKAKSYMLFDENKNYEVKTAGFHFDKETVKNMTTENFLKGVTNYQLQKSSGEYGKILSKVDKHTKHLLDIWPNADWKKAINLSINFDNERKLLKYDYFSKID